MDVQVGVQKNVQAVATDVLMIVAVNAAGIVKGATSLV